MCLLLPLSSFKRVHVSISEKSRMNLELLNFLFIWKTQPIVHEELESETPKPCFFGSIKETFGEMAQGVSVMLGNVPERMSYKIL